MEIPENFCKNCGKLITELRNGKPITSRMGRPRMFCSERCKRAFYRKDPVYRELERMRNTEARRIARAKKKKLNLEVNE